MYRIVLLVSAICMMEVSCETIDDNCVTNQDVQTLNTIVDSFVNLEETINNSTNITQHNTVHAILDTICNDPTIRALVDTIEKMVNACPELVTASHLPLLNIGGTLTFEDLLENFQGVDHFCGCVPTLLQVMALEEVKSNITMSDPSVLYPEIVDLDVLCMRKPTTPPVNFTQAALLADINEIRCSRAFLYSSVNILRMKGFIMYQCPDYNPDDFACALNYTSDHNLTDCINSVNKEVTPSPRHDSITIFSGIYDCMRSACVNEHMNCSQRGRDLYMISVNFYLESTDFQLAMCDVNDGTKWLPSLSLIVLSSIVAVLRL